MEILNQSHQGEVRTAGLQGVYNLYPLNAFPLWQDLTVLVLGDSPKMSCAYYSKTATFSPANKVEILRMHLDGISHEQTRI
jgi:hypothetical protein